jgi:hypothetical protein
MLLIRSEKSAKPLMDFTFFIKTSNVLIFFIFFFYNIMTYERFSLEIAQYAKAGANIIIS